MKTSQTFGSLTLNSPLVQTQLQIIQLTPPYSKSICIYLICLYLKQIQLSKLHAAKNNQKYARPAHQAQSEIQLFF